MTRLTVTDSLCLPGDPARPNEDRVGHTGTCAFVIDGATGLGASVAGSAEGTDAAWLAAFAAAHLKAGLAADPGADVGALVARTNSAARAHLADRTDLGALERWAWPVAGFLLARMEGPSLAAHGLGDCVLFLADADGPARRHCPLGENHAREAEDARAAIARHGGLRGGHAAEGDAIEQQRQRALRARYNTPGGPLYTLGLVPKAGAHVVRAAWPVAAPARGIVCTDGFAALVDRYRRYTPGSLIDAASEVGLAALGEELRAVERVEDPEGHIYPRMKMSDDAGAVLFTLS